MLLMLAPHQCYRVATWDFGSVAVQMWHQSTCSMTIAGPSSDRTFPAILSDLQGNRRPTWILRLITYSQ